ncbi:MAG: glycosyltransferase family 4 protein, partial [Candidatus Binatia bacterium]
LQRTAAALPGVEGVLFGDGPERSRVEALLRERPGVRVRLAGRLPSEAVGPALAECQAVALLSDYEGLPIAVLEAMSVGVVPVCLATRSGVEELIEDGRTGLLVGDRDADFTHAIARLRADPDLWLRLSEAARQRVAQEFSIERNVTGWLELCEELASASRPRAIREPARIDLPPIHPDLAREDERRRPAWRRWLAGGNRRVRTAWSKSRARWRRARG